MTDQNIKALNDLLSKRRSVRGYLSKPVPEDTLKACFEMAQRSPSNCNTQSWHVYVASGDTRARLRTALVDAVKGGSAPTPDFIYFDKFDSTHQKRRVKCAVELYENMGIERHDREGRGMAMLRNYEFFDAPHVAYICMPKNYDHVNVVDAGIYIQTLMLALTAHGISSVAQGALTFYPDPAKEILGIPEHLGVVVGLSFGYEDESVDANKTIMDRVPLDKSVTFLG